MRSLTLLIILGALLRVWFALTSNHIYYPDEIYQTLEQSHRMVYGYGVIPWDVAYGLRSMVIPLLLAGPLWLLKAGGITDPQVYTVVLKVVIAGISLVIIPASYAIVKTLSRKKELALLAAFLAATWYELIYFSSRALSETISAYIFATAILFLLWKRQGVIFGFLLMLASLLRIQYAPILFVLWLVGKREFPAKLMAVGAAVAILLFGMVDFIFYGNFFSSIPTNIRLSFLSGISEIFGTQPWHFYVTSLLIGSSGLIGLVFYDMYRSKLKQPVILTLALLIGLHTLLGHKEYRFVFAAIPLWLMGISLAIDTKKVVAVGALAIIISVAGFLNLAPYQTRLYGQPLLLTDPHLDLYTRLSKDASLCGLLDVNRTWVYTGGYYYLHQPVPIYTYDDPSPAANAISHFITEQSELQLAGFHKIVSTGRYDVYTDGSRQTVNGYSLYKRVDDTCVTKPAIYLRNFAVIDEVLQQAGAKPVLTGVRLE